MSGDLRLDHIVIRVGNLDDAMRDYRQLGFTVVPGGSHEDAPTHNALIGLDDDSYLELIAFRPAAPGAPGAAFERMLRGWQDHPQGLVAFALVPVAIEPVIARLRDAGLAIEGPAPGGRRRPDGRQVAWQLGIPDAPELPFLCADVTPRPLRLPDPEARRHQNGANGVAELTVAVRDAEASAARYGAMLAIEAPTPRLDASLGANVVSLRIGGPTVTLAAPARDDTWLGEHLSSRGEGPCRLTLATAKSAEVGPLDLARAHGARVALAAV